MVGVDLFGAQVWNEQCNKLVEVVEKVVNPWYIRRWCIPVAVIGPWTEDVVCLQGRCNQVYHPGDDEPSLEELVDHSNLLANIGICFIMILEVIACSQPSSLEELSQFELETLLLH